jgi:NTP pyrophosphatase (non-canonical NTP hydrolase)
MADTLQRLAGQLRDFAAARDWEQFHSPKNLASALIVEAAELLEHFQWTTEEESRAISPEKREEVAGEMADVLLYLVQLASALNVDLGEAALKKIQKNAERYPEHLARGTSRKHNEL